MADISRRNAIGIIAVGSIGLGLQASAQNAPVQIGELTKLGKEWDSIGFEYANTKALLVRVAKPAAETKRVLEVKQGQTSVWLSAYTLVCTHEGCTPAMPNAERILECPCHGSAFKAQDGTVVAGPARDPLRAVKLEVREGAVFAVGFLD